MSRLNWNRARKIGPALSLADERERFGRDRAACWLERAERRQRMERAAERRRARGRAAA
jgi:hypothetical protein